MSVALQWYTRVILMHDVVVLIGARIVVTYDAVCHFSCALVHMYSVDNVYSCALMIMYCSGALSLKNKLLIIELRTP